jgi:hypothetical protein
MTLSTIPIDPRIGWAVWARITVVLDAGVFPFSAKTRALILKTSGAAKSIPATSLPATTNSAEGE